MGSSLNCVKGPRGSAEEEERPQSSRSAKEERRRKKEEESRRKKQSYGATQSSSPSATHCTDTNPSQLIRETGAPHCTDPSQLIRETETDHFEEARKFEVEIILDETTAHPNLKISASDGVKTLQLTDERDATREINEKRFDEEPFVLGAMVNSRRAYWEVSVQDKEYWTLGVVGPKAERKGHLKLSPAKEFWVIRLLNGNKLEALDKKHKSLPENTKLPNKVGVFLDYNEKKVSFYNVDTKSLLYTFDNGPGFENKVFPMFSPGEDTTPMCICPNAGEVVPALIPGLASNESI